MATHCLALDQWTAEYHLAMAAAAGAKLRLTLVSKGISIRLAIPVWKVAKDFQVLVSSLEELESLPAAVLQAAPVDVPSSLRKLFRTTCEMLQSAESKGLDRNLLTRDSISRIAGYNQELAAYADRFEDSLQKLSVFSEGEEAESYKDSLAAYRGCGPVTDEARDEDVTPKVLNF
jgi:hypothetical protein